MCTRYTSVLVLLIAGVVASPAWPAQDDGQKMGPLARERALLLTGSSRVIVQATDSAAAVGLANAIAQAGGRAGRALSLIDARVADVPNTALAALANNPVVVRISLDRPVLGSLERTGATVGATAVRQNLGLDGSGITVAIIDSGIMPSHDDLAGPNGPRVLAFVDYVNGRTLPYDDYGHGTHVAGIAAGNGFDSGGARTGIAPAANLVALKVLDASGAGTISNVIAALGYAVANRNALHIRIVNLSVSAGVYESYNTDPLTLAARRAVNAGLVVVAAAGNVGRDSAAVMLYGGSTAPGNAPWVVTVGASNHQGTAERFDDTMAVFSSRGPGAVDYGAKPDVVAPGVGIESLSDPASALYTAKAAYLLPGTAPTSYFPYLSLSGTSMAAPVVTGTVALMLQANGALTPNAVKAILQYTARPFANYDYLTQGTGLLNARGAVDLARFFAGSLTDYPSGTGWGAQLIWGNQLIGGGRIMPGTNAWSADATWGAALTARGQNIEWGIRKADGWRPWRTECLDQV
jgi:serine protease AprX